jgi:hypothetical protein
VLVVGVFSQSEVDDNWHHLVIAAVFSTDHDVLELQIAVHHTFLVQIGDSLQ